MDKKAMEEKLSGLEQRLGYTFKNKALLVNALTHTSYVHEKGLSKLDSYERLEFLGDAVLELVVSEYLYKSMPDESEGNLTRLRAAVVCEPSFAGVGADLGFGEYMFLGKGEEANGGRGRASLVADIFEAVVAAIYLDSDMDTVKKWIIDHLKETVRLANQGKAVLDYKTMLQERLQKGDTGKVSYRVTGQSGPDHAKRFEVEVMVDGIVKASGEGSSKKDAEQNAAAAVLEQLDGR